MVLNRDSERDLCECGVARAEDFARHFAELPVEHFRPLLEAATEDARLRFGPVMLRFRPVMMTSLAFILGLPPLVLAPGASEPARRGRMLERAPAKC